ncbi:hypothetical protein BVRB_6g136140 [Beta vulgaris subsp. vulgaris]|nr:hypothetical protein BVRB_6g136140 [Beta vulgaris subsp. vulgaris]
MSSYQETNEVNVRNLLEEIVALAIQNEPPMGRLNEILRSIPQNTRPPRQRRHEEPPVGKASLVPADASAVANLRSMKVKEMACVRDEVCSLCLGEWHKEEEVTFLPCDHKFHTVCVNKWLKINHVCPLCRFELPSENL